VRNPSGREVGPLRAWHTARQSSNRDLEAELAAPQFRRTSGKRTLLDRPSDTVPSPVNLEPELLADPFPSISGETATSAACFDDSRQVAGLMTRATPRRRTPLFAPVDSAQSAFAVCARHGPRPRACGCARAFGRVEIAPGCGSDVGGSSGAAASVTDAALPRCRVERSVGSGMARPLRMAATGSAASSADQLGLDLRRAVSAIRRARFLASSACLKT